MRWRRRTKGLHSAPPAARSAFHTDSDAASSPTGAASQIWVATRSQRNWPMVMRVPGGPKPKWRATYCQKCWGTKMCRRRVSSGPVTASTAAIQARLARAKRHQCQRRWSRITACPASQATMDSGENQTSTSMTSSRPLAAGWRAARGIGWPGVACQPLGMFLESGRFTRYLHGG